MRECYKNVFNCKLKINSGLFHLFLACLSQVEFLSFSPYFLKKKKLRRNCKKQVKSMDLDKIFYVEKIDKLNIIIRLK